MVGGIISGANCPYSEVLICFNIFVMFHRTCYTSATQLNQCNLGDMFLRHPVMQEDVSRHTLISCEHAGAFFACVTHGGMCAQGVTRVTGH